MGRMFVCGNWKLHKTVPEAVELARAVRQRTEELRARFGERMPLVGVAPGFLALEAVARVLESGPVILAAQDGFWEPKGAYTGEVSFAQLADVGCSHVVVGHSERRKYFGETDDVVARKVRGALDAGLVPILCVGETLEEREAGRAQEVVGRQLRRAIEGLSDQEVARLVVAYEPVWAIGTGRTATPEQAQEMHSFVRGLLRESAGEEAAEACTIQYGGSVKPNNAASLLSQPDVDGALVGGASLEAESFAAILAAAAEQM